MRVDAQFIIDAIEQGVIAINNYIDANTDLSDFDEHEHAEYHIREFTDDWPTVVEFADEKIEFGDLVHDALSLVRGEHHSNLICSWAFQA